MLASLRRLSAPVAGRLPRTVVIDVARGIAMVVVLYGHAIEVLFEQRPDGRFLEQAFVQYKAMAGFAMAVFFMVSGAAAASIATKTWRSVLRTSLFLVALAYLVHGAGLLLRLLEIALTGDGHLVQELLGGLEAMLKGRGFSTVVVWFLVALAATRVIVYALFRTLSRPQAYLAVLAIGLSSLLVPSMPNAFMAKTWSVGVVFFALGMAVAPHAGRFTRLSAWPLLLLLPLSLWFALQNRGCPYDPWSSCPIPHLGDTVVWIHLGENGFIPLYWAAALSGAVGVFALAGLLVRWRLAGPLAHIGVRTMGLLIINGFVLVFLQRWLKAVPIDEISLSAFPLILVGVVALHLLALHALQRPLGALNTAAAKLAEVGLSVSGWVVSGMRAPLRRTNGG